jgi:hypothetical protein
VFAGKKSAQIREILISESAWEEMTCLFAPSLAIMGSLFFIVCIWPNGFLFIGSTALSTIGVLDKKGSLLSYYI